MSALLGLMVASCSTPTNPEQPDVTAPQDQTSGTDAQSDLEDLGQVDMVPEDQNSANASDVTPPQDVSVDLGPNDLDSLDSVEETTSDTEVCVPDCAGKECGSDGCEGSCGTCPGAAPVCSTAGLCTLDCPPTECTLGELRCMDGQEQTCDLPCPAPAACTECWTWRTTNTCPLGSSCEGNVCVNGQNCAWAESQRTQLGCRFLAMDLPVYADTYSPILPSTAPYGVMLVNPLDKTALVSFTHTLPGTAWEQPAVSLCGKCSQVVQLPNHTASPTAKTFGSVVIESDSPVVVFQLNPLDTSAASNGASLLWPTTVGGTDFWVTTQATSPLETLPGFNLPSQYGYFAILSLEPGPNTVQLWLTAQSTAQDGTGAPLPAGELPSQLTLNQNEVLWVSASGASGMAPYDLNGSHIVSDKPIHVFGGHEEAAVCGQQVEDTCCADHVAEQLLPSSQWGGTYIVVKSPIRWPGESDVYRIQAGSNPAQLATIPPIAGINGIALGAGDWIEAPSSTDFVLTATAPVQVVQYLAGQGCVGAKEGDPAMNTMIPVSRHGSLFVAAPVQGYTRQAIVLVRPTGQAVQVNGVTLSDQLFTTVGASGYQRTEIALAGFTSIECQGLCAAYAYGYGATAGYAMPLGGMFGQ